MPVYFAVTNNVPLIKAVAVTFNPASVAANTTAEQACTVTGVASGDVVLACNKPTATAGLGVVGARVSAANTLQITFINATAAPIDAGSEAWIFVIARPSETPSVFN